MADANAESIQQKIQIARRDAEALKDRIKRKKDDLADGTRKYINIRSSISSVSLWKCDPKLMMGSFSCQHREKSTRSPSPQPDDEDTENPQRTSCEDLCHALVHRQEAFSVCLAGW